MAKELFILRHGKSDWSADADDFHRPLKQRGRHEAQKMGIWLAQNDLIPDYVVTSPAARALSTAAKCCKAMGVYHSGLHEDSRIYAASADELVAVVRGLPSTASRVLLVGHNPGLELLLQRLVGRLELPFDGRLMPTATLARVRLAGEWSQAGDGDASLVSITRPGSLPDKFPFSGPEGFELRNRPAYYYTQSGVIPWRLRDGAAEIMLVSSSKNRHWIVPKGIKEPGLSLRDSAIKEALEEAGVEGRVDDKPLGCYHYTKWGATCSVEMFPMEVTRVMGKKEWQESHRERGWVTVKQASRLLKHKELAKMVVALGNRIATSAAAG